MASAINEALCLSAEERSIKHKLLYDYICSNSAHFWADSFIRELQQTARIPAESNPTPALCFPTVKTAYAIAKKRLFFLDYDVNSLLLQVFIRLHIQL